MIEQKSSEFKTKKLSENQKFIVIGNFMII
jgi:hypothetical protein